MIYFLIESGLLFRNFIIARVLVARIGKTKHMHLGLARAKHAGWLARALREARAIFGFNEHPLVNVYDVIKFLRIGAPRNQFNKKLICK